MKIILDHVTSTENTLQGMTESGICFRALGVLRFTENGTPEFSEGKIMDGPLNFTGWKCTAIIDDTSAEVEITPSVSPRFKQLFVTAQN